ncbi:unnamed protein product [Musa acuminata subsp. burmannicoides]
MVWQQDKAFWFPMLLCTQVLSACTPVLGEDASMELPQQSCHLRRWKIAARSKLFSTKSMTLVSAVSTTTTTTTTTTTCHL